MSVEASGLFMTSEQAAAQEKHFGHRYNGRYHMPLLPDEQGTKAGGDWVPWGVQSTTELVSAFAESRALNIWEQEQLLYGLFRNPSLMEEAALLFGRWQREGVDFSRIGDFPEVRRALTGGGKREVAEASIVGRAKQAAGANEARQAGTNRHTAWEHYCLTGEFIGTPDIIQQTQAVAKLLDGAGLEVLPGLCERVIRNTVVNAAGRFDNILRERPTGRLLMADLKTKRKAFWSYMEVDAQLAVYAHADYMLEWNAGQAQYVDGPVHHVDLNEGVVLHAPSTGTEPHLRRADLVAGWETAKLARVVTERRAAGKSAARLAESEWIPAHLRS